MHGKGLGFLPIERNSMKRIFLSFFGLILITIVILDFAFAPLVSRVADHYLQNQINAYLRNLVKGVFYMVHNDLKTHPEDQWPLRMADIRPNFGFPINIQKASDINLGSAERLELDDGIIVIKEDGELFYQKVRPTDWVVIVGPVKDMEEDMEGLVWLIVMAYIGAIIMVGLLSIVWAWPFWRRLQLISTAALAFGDGQLETRTIVPRRSALAPLADAFNRMANRIEHLINAQKELTNTISHELRTPISRIRFSFEMLDDSVDESERKHYMAEISKDIEELEDLVTESLTYARLEQGTLLVQWQNRVLEPWIRQLTVNATKNHLHIDYCCNNNLAQPDRQVYLDVRFMERAVGNLVQNAVVHAKSRVEVTLTEDGQDCVIHVDDDGPGIPRIDRRRVFQAFTRLDTSRNRASGGYGMGLAIVQRVIAWHGGRAIVTDAPIGGARFTIRWPGFSAKKPETSEKNLKHQKKT
jgi:signal transduction histidine kinase